MARNPGDEILFILKLQSSIETRFNCATQWSSQSVLTFIELHEDHGTYEKHGILLPSVLPYNDAAAMKFALLHSPAGCMRFGINLSKSASGSIADTTV
jgi:hypothetical protein